MTDALGLDRPTDDPLLWLMLSREPGLLEMGRELDEGDRHLVGLFDLNLVSLARCSLDRNPGKSNWVEDQGGLPNYICEIARSIHRKRGLSISRSISIAVGAVKNWASGQGDVDADTRAKAAKAVAQWEAKKAKARAKRAKK